MIPVANPIPEPPSFDAGCRQPGKTWLQKNPTSQNFPTHWRTFLDDLAAGFHERCGWWAMRIGDGAVDHYLSKLHHRHLAYEWSNYRYIAPTANSGKKNWDAAILDPFHIQPGWFEVQLPSMLLVPTPALPQNLAQMAAFTIEKLHLNGSKIRRNRIRWYQDYKDKGLPLENLADFAPLIASAVQELQKQGRPLP